MLAETPGETPFLSVVIYPKPTAKCELIITKRERARGWFGIKNIVI